MYTLYMLRTLFLDHAPRDLAVKAMSLGVENWADGLRGSAENAWNP
jgi:hypothetical protein